MQIQLTRSQLHDINPLISELNTFNSIQNCIELADFADELLTMHNDKQGWAMDSIRLIKSVLTVESAIYDHKEMKCTSDGPESNPNPAKRLCGNC